VARLSRPANPDDDVTDNFQGPIPQAPARHQRPAGSHGVRSGAVSYLVSHFLNHALGNISLDALAFGVYIMPTSGNSRRSGSRSMARRRGIQGSGSGRCTSAGSFAGRRSSRCSWCSGLSIPALIVAHVVGVRLGEALYGQEKHYPQVFYAYWVAAPHKMWLMYLVLIVAWVHGCVGLYFWLRMKVFFKRAAPFLFAAAILVPTLRCSASTRAGEKW